MERMTAVIKEGENPAAGKNKKQKTGGKIQQRQKEKERRERRQIKQKKKEK